MINFNDLQVVESMESSYASYYKESRILFIAGAEPCLMTDKELSKGLNVFYVYSKVSGKIIFLMRTKRNFDWFLDYIKIYESFKTRLKVTRKFVTEDGRTKTIEQVRVETGGFKEYLDS